MGDVGNNPTRPGDPTLPEEATLPSSPASEIVLELMLEWSDDELVRRRLEEIAEHFVVGRRERIDYQLKAVARVPGSMRGNKAGHALQRTITSWIREHASRSGIGKDTFFLSVPGIPVRLRVDIAPGRVSPILTFTAISR